MKSRLQSGASSTKPTKRLNIFSTIYSSSSFRANKGQIVGGTAGQEFKRSAKYSTPLVHQLDKQDDIPYQL
jgi:hypothetical protein